MELIGKKVKLRAIEPEDLEMLRALRNDPEFENMVVGWAVATSKRDQCKWYESFSNSQYEMRYTIETKEDGAVGMIGLINIDYKNATALGGGMRIARTEHRCRGIATDAWMTLLRYAFNELRLNRITGTALVTNTASLRVCEKVGFQKEGICREAVYKNGRHIDVVIMSVLKSDYNRLVEETGYWK